MVHCTSPRWLRPTWATIHVTQMDMSNFFKPTLFKWMVSGSQKTTSVSFLSETAGCCDPKRTFLVINFIQYKPQTCSLHCWGPDQHESAQRVQQRVLTIPTHQVLLTDDTWATALFTRSIFFQVLSKRGTSAPGPCWRHFPHRKKTCMRSVWQHDVRVLYSQNDWTK